MRLSITSSEEMFPAFLVTNIVNPYMIIFNSRDKWDQAKFGVAYHDYKLIDDCLVIEQANEI